MRDPAGVLTCYYYDATNLLFAFDKGGVRYYVATDQVGTPKVISDATGTIVKTIEHDSFGMVTTDSNPDFVLPVGFAGGITDLTTGLVRFGFRDYEPTSGRWTAKDPIFFGGGQGNLYVYVQNNPVNFTDPEGKELILGVVGALAGAVVNGVNSYSSGGDWLAGAGIGFVAGGVAGLINNPFAAGAIYGALSTYGNRKIGVMNDCDPVVDYSIGIGVGALGSKVGYGVGGSAMTEGIGQQVGMFAASSLGNFAVGFVNFFRGF